MYSLGNRAGVDTDMGFALLLVLWWRAAFDYLKVMSRTGAARFYCSDPGLVGNAFPQGAIKSP